METSYKLVMTFADDNDVESSISINNCLSSKSISADNVKAVMNEIITNHVILGKNDAVLTKKVGALFVETTKDEQDLS